MLSTLKQKAGSDQGAVGTVETILLIALAVFAVMIVMKYIMGPLQESSKGIGNSIKEMNPDTADGGGPNVTPPGDVGGPENGSGGGSLIPGDGNLDKGGGSGGDFEETPGDERSPIITDPPIGINPGEKER